jgi:hypothetical protein
MKYEIFYDPVAHIVIDNFFNDEEYSLLFDSIEKVEEKMHLGTFQQISYLNGKQKQIKDLFLKNNFNLWPDENSSIEESIILNLVKNKIFSVEMKKIYVSVQDSTFQYFHFANVGSILLSKYKKGGFYDWHYDTSASVTGNILLSKDDVIGGNFLMKSVHGKVKEVKFKTNRCLLFPALCVHKVTEVKNECNRYSIQCFSSINLEK